MNVGSFASLTASPGKTWGKRLTAPDGRALCSTPLPLFGIENANLVAPHRHRNRHRRLVQLDGDLVFALVDALDLCLLAFERAGDEFDDVALGDPLDVGLRR